MAEGLITSDGTPIDVEAAAQVEREFAQAMAAPAGQVPAPQAAKAEVEDKPRRGRPPKADKHDAPRVANAGRKPAPVKPKAPLKDSYVDDVNGVISTAWVVAAGIPYTKPYSTVLYANSDALVAALAEGCKHNDQLRNFFTNSTEMVWWLPLLTVGVQMTMQGMAIARDPEARKAASELADAQLMQMLQGAQEVK